MPDSDLDSPAWTVTPARYLAAREAPFARPAAPSAATRISPAAAPVSVGNPPATPAAGVAVPTPQLELGLDSVPRTVAGADKVKA